MSKTSRSPAWQQALVVIAGTLVGVVVVTVLYWAQVVSIPVALGVFLAFLLSPLVLALQRRGLGRIPSVVLVFALAALVLGGVGWLVTVQFQRLAAELPQHTPKVKEKIRALRTIDQGSSTEGLERMVEEIFGEFKSPPPGQEVAVPKPSEGARTDASEPPRRVIVEPESTAWLSRLPGVVVPVLGPVGAVGLAIVLAIFMLLKREDLRNRFIRLVGHGRMVVTTKAVDEAAARISRYLLMQLIVNSTYGLAWGLGLWIIGVDYALLWGFLAAILRYVPYIGAPLAALLPIALSVITSDGWTEPLLAAGLLVVLELVSNNIIEPWLYGQSIGVSEVALLVAAAFWTFLWGPIGLVLSGPLTVCLVVLGRYVPQLEFFDVLLGDEPALEPDVTFYQRLLARDQDEAAELALAQLKASPPEQVYDELLVPALSYTKCDRERDDLTEADEQFIFRATGEILEDLGERRVAAISEEAKESSPEETKAPAPAPIRALLCPARDEADRLALEMLRQLLDPARWDAEVTAVETLTGELVTRTAEEQPALICIGSLPPGGLAHTRYLCKRLRAHFPEVKIVVGRWGFKDKPEATQEQFLEAGADVMTTNLLETRNQLNGLHSVLAHAQTSTPTSDEEKVLHRALA